MVAARAAPWPGGTHSAVPMIATAAGASAKVVSTCPVHL
jgi:hypothetical protein